MPFYKGHTITNTGRTRFKKGAKINLGESNPMFGKPPWNKGKKLDYQAEENNHEWKGDKASYTALHQWVKRKLGKPQECVFCGKDRLDGIIQWASISHKAKRDLDDYIPLCPKCHKGYDVKGEIYV